MLLSNVLICSDCCFKCYDTTNMCAGIGMNGTRGYVNVSVPVADTAGTSADVAVDDTAGTSADVSNTTVIYQEPRLPSQHPIYGMPSIAQ